MKGLFRLWRTVRYLKVRQITNRLYRRIFKPRVDNERAPALRPIPRSANFILRSESIIGKGVFDFLNKQNTLSFPDGWNDSKYPKLWLYNLHYFEGLMNFDTPAILKKQLVKQWIEENPTGQGNGWEPYPNSLRICNWIKWHLLTGELSDEASQSLAVQVRYLSGTLEYHLLGNHLLANAKALIFAGIFFDGEEAEKWFKKGLKILKEQMPEQFLSDGAHFELSTTYHTLLTEDLLDIFHLLKVANTNIPDLEDTISRALSWLQVMTHPHGDLPLFNDAAYGVTPTPIEVLTYASELGMDIPIFEPSGMTDLPSSGYFRFDTPSYSLISDAGQIGPSYLPGHAHCDMLSFELSINKQPFLVDTGTSTYGTEPRRHYERSTAAHNTVQVDDHEQSEIWGEFRVGRRAKIIRRILGDMSADLMLKSQYYSHRRKIDYSDATVTIVDNILKKNNTDQCTARFHFHPSISPRIEGISVETESAHFFFEGAQTITLKESKYAPEFNKLEENLCLEVTFDQALRTTINFF